MPELPEVEAARLAVCRAAKGRRIVVVRCADDPLVFETAPARVRRALTGRRVVDAHRHGKYLWLELDARPWPVFHFGMTGGFHERSAPGAGLATSGCRPAAQVWPPRFTRFRMTLEGGHELAFADARRLGRIRLRHDPRSEPPVSLLGFDALRELPSPRRFRALLRARKAALKAVLLDQTFAAGVGNWIADEVLYQARLDPRRPAATLSDAEADRLRAKLRAVVTTSVRALNDSDRYPRTWLFHDRWGREPGALTAREESIRYLTIAGRTTAWVPSVQR